MNRELLSRAFGGIDEVFVAEAFRQPASGAAPGASGRPARRRTKCMLAAALAAALLLALGAAAYAAFSGGWLSAFFAARQGSALSPRQQAYLEAESMEVSRSQTADGYTITVETAICDRMELCLVLRIEGPEDVTIDLDSTQGEGSLWFSSVKISSLSGKERTGSVGGVSTHGSHLPDGDGKANTARLVLMTQRELSSDSNQGFSDGELWRVSISGLYTMTGKHFENKTILSEGEWVFEFPLSEGNEELEMIISPVACTALYGGEGKPKETVEVEVTSFVLRPLGANCVFRLPQGWQAGSPELLDVCLILKNGDRVRMMPVSGGAYGDYGRMYYRFEAPVLLDDVESLVLPENVTVPCPGK